MKVTIDINLERLRYSLVGDGYLLEEVKEMSEEELIRILNERIERKINDEFYTSLRYGLLDGTR